MNNRNRVLLADSATPALALAAAGPAVAATSALPLAYPQARRPRGVIGAPRAKTDADPAEILRDLQTTHAAFKNQLDTMQGRVDALDAAKIQAMNETLTGLQSAMDEINRKLAASTLTGGGDGKDTPDRRAYSQAFNAAFRRGGDDAELHALAIKAAMTTQSDPDGGWLVPTEMEGTIDRVLGKVSAIRALATVRSISTSEYKKMVNVGGVTSGWVGETDARPNGANPKLVALAFEAMELFANPYASQGLLDDASVDIGAWLADECSIEFAEQEGGAFVSGDGMKKPKGILAYNTVTDDNYAWGKIGYVGTGGAGFAADPNGLDALIKLTYRLKQGYRQNASWLMNRFTVSSARLLKDSEGRYAWQPSSQIGQPATLLGYPISDDDNMDDLGANKFPVAFADFKRAYVIVDRMGIRVLRDPYTNKPYVSFYTTKRVGGGVQNFEAIKLLKCA